MKRDEQPGARKLDPETHHNAYSVESAMNHYKNVVYYSQRKGGDGWFHGRVSDSFRQNYDQIDWRK